MIYLLHSHRFRRVYPIDMDLIDCRKEGFAEPKLFLMMRCPLFVEGLLQGLGDGKYFRCVCGFRIGAPCRPPQSSTIIQLPYAWNSPTHRRVSLYYVITTKLHPFAM